MRLSVRVEIRTSGCRRRRRGPGGIRWCARVRGQSGLGLGRRRCRDAVVETCGPGSEIFARAVHDVRVLRPALSAVRQSHSAAASRWWPAHRSSGQPHASPFQTIPPLWVRAHSRGAVPTWASIVTASSMSVAIGLFSSTCPSAGVARSGEREGACSPRISSRRGRPGRPRAQGRTGLCQPRL